ncbi:MAG: hypothetical protein AB1742_12455 [bacterium]
MKNRGGDLKKRGKYAKRARRRHSTGAEIPPPPDRGGFQTRRTQRPSAAKTAPKQDKPPCDARTKIDPDDVRRWLIDYQHGQIMKRYEDAAGGERVKKYFSEFMYPPCDARDGYVERNEFFRRIVNVYVSGRLHRYLGPFGGLFRPQVEHVEKMNNLADYLIMAVKLYDLTNELDGRMVDHLCRHCSCHEHLNDDAYRAAFCACSTRDERKSQVDMIIALGEYARKIIEKGGLTDFLIETCPSIPVFSRSPFVHGVNEAIRMVKTAYRSFKSHRDRLVELRDMSLRREYAYLDEIFSSAPKGGEG